MVKNVLRLIMLLGPLAFLIANCGSYKPSKYDPNQRYTAKNYSSGEGSLRENIAQHAKRFIGVPYKHAGTTPKGFDCSGFTSYVMKDYVPIPRSSFAQAEKGKRVEIKAVQPGDLIFFSKNGKGKISHVALVVANNREGVKVAHSTSSRGVIVENISQSKYWKPKIKFARDVISR